MSRTIGDAFEGAAQLVAACRAPSVALRLIRPSSRYASIAASPAAHASGEPPKVLPCAPGVEHVADRLRVGERAHREPAAEALGQAHDVGLDAGVLDREPLAGAAEAGLDLVDDQQRAALAADALRGLQEIRRADVDAALALHDFEDRPRRSDR